MTAANWMKADYTDPRDASIAALRARLGSQEAESVRLREALDKGCSLVYSYIDDLRGEDYPDTADRIRPQLQEIEAALAANPRTALLVAVLEAAHVACPPGKYPNTALGAAIDALRAFDAGQEGVNG